ncbi:MAG: tRNA uridine-5-carboxymethylaminomethyl(34) synthesis GTPase MnmE [Spirochaetes bacterium]|nr:tRNA uridine-5-carboxymethylaminomethyl(34) synthesis GTPase MnmE [Spirochaetota bacterium]MBU0956976.1 tRNA uridine-5-carboxymethylaminomethyl(34) synthesis GTPase MnmE [Spirochaetota bacterium]
MSRGYLASNDRIAALATAPGAAAIAVVRIAGPGCIEELASLFSKPDRLRQAASHQAIYGRLLRPDRRPVDEVLALVFRAPGGYTGQDSVDILCHGGTAVTQAVLNLLLDNGFQRALPGEFTFRAFMNGKMDLARAEAVDELVKAETDVARANALTRLSGALSRRISALHGQLVHLAAACALHLDYGEDESPDDFSAEAALLHDVRDQCRQIADSYSVGRLLKEGARVIIAGRTNAGKSSLFNCLLKEERAIVSDRHGTTRDYVEAALDLGGFPVQLIDTAGLRESEDAVESEGIRRSRLLLDAADLVLYVVDAVEGLDAADDAFLTGFTGKLLPVWNKLDHPKALPAPADLPSPAGIRWLLFSALQGSGEAELVQAIQAALLSGQQSVPAESAITSERQRNALLRAASALDEAADLLKRDLCLDMLAVDINTALAALGEISGETSSEDILDAMFSSFCVGK